MSAAISIVMPLFNKAAFVAEAVLGLACQLGPRDELIVVDDRSTDDGAARVAGLALERVRLIHLEVNDGPATARNEGARLATGEYLLFFDADDLPHPHLLAVLKDCIDRFPGEAVFAYDLAFEAHGEAFLPKKVLCNGPAPTDIRPRDEFVKSCLRGRPLCTASSTCVRADIFRQAGGFRPGLRYCEDPELWARLSAAHPMVRIACTLAVYRDVPQSLSYGFRSKPGSIQAYVSTLLELSQEPGDSYGKLARLLIVKNTVFSASRGADRHEMLGYLQSVRSVLGELNFAGLCALAWVPQTMLRWPLALRALIARTKLRRNGLARGN